MESYVFKVLCLDDRLIRGGLRVVDIDLVDQFLGMSVKEFLNSVN